MTVRVTNNQLTFILGSESVSAPIATDGTYNHYALAYEAETGTMRIIENDTIILQQWLRKTSTSTPIIPFL